MFVVEDLAVMWFGVPESAREQPVGVAGAVGEVVVVAGTGVVVVFVGIVVVADTDRVVDIVVDIVAVVGIAAVGTALVVDIRIVGDIGPAVQESLQPSYP